MLKPSEAVVGGTSLRFQGKCVSAILFLSFSILFDKCLFVGFASRLVFLSKGGVAHSKHHIKFRENGYNNFPEIVFWNLRNSKATLVPSNQSGVALVSPMSYHVLCKIW